MVATPAEPEDTLAETEVKGLAVVETESTVALPACELLADAVGAFDDPAVSDGVLPLAVPETRPVMPERVGTDCAWLLPIVAYACPSWRAKNGRGEGDS